jgi:membrane-associated phospholipid phosphatase
MASTITTIVEKYEETLERPLVRILLVLPFVFWLILYTSAPAIPSHSRPDIDVTSLYDFDIAFLHYLPSTELAKLQNVVFDVLGAIAYTLHAGWPFVFLAYLVFFKRRDLILPYWNCFGLVCFLGLVTQLIMPTAPPWYYYKYGFDKSFASYNMTGDPAGLARVDKRFDIEFYKNMFLNSPVVFGSFPSLHIGWPSTTALFVYFETTLPIGLRIASFAYVAYVALAVMYLQHHYFVDVFGGLLYAFAAYKLLRPRKNARRSGQWGTRCGVDIQKFCDAA